MKGYCTAVLLASVCGALCASFAGGKFEKYIRYVSALICIVLILSPLRSLDLSLPMHPEMSASAQPESGMTLEALATARAKTEIEAYLSDALLRETGIQAREVCIEIEQTDGEAVITAIRFRLQREQAEHALAVQDWAETAFGVPSVVDCEETEG